MVCFSPDKFFKILNKHEIQWVFCLCAKDLSRSVSRKSCSSVKLSAASALQHEQVTSFWSSGGGGLLKVHGARSRSSLLRNKHRIALQAVSISQPVCGLWTASLNVLFFRGCPTKNIMDFQLDWIACVGPGCPVPGSNDQGAEVALLLLGLVFCPLFPCTNAGWVQGHECWMGPGTGPRLSFCSLKCSWIAFVVKWAALLCWFSQISMGRVYWAEIMCNWSVQCSCTEGKKSCLHRWTQPRLAPASEITVFAEKAKKLIYVDSPFTLQDRRQRCSGLCHSAVWPWQKPTWKQEAFSQRELTPAASTCTSTLLENHLHLCHISNATTGEHRTRVSSFVLGINLVCRQLHWSDGTRIIRFINGGLKSQLHGVKGACKQLNVSNSKVVFWQGDEGWVGMNAG